MWFLRRMLCIPWTENKTNEMVSKEAETKRSLVQKIREQLATFFGNVMRRDGLENFITTGKIDRKRSKNAGHPEVLVGCLKNDGYDVGNSRPRRLERHDRQRHEAGHLMDGYGRRLYIQVISSTFNNFRIVSSQSLYI